LYELPPRGSLLGFLSRRFRQFEQDVAGARWIDKRDATLPMPHDRGVMQELDTLAAKFLQGGIDIFNLKTYVKEALAPLGYPLCASRLGSKALDQLDRAITQRKQRDASIVLQEIFSVIELETEYVPQYRRHVSHVVYSDRDVLDAHDFHIFSGSIYGCLRRPLASPK
jgi:hypothetical protein